MLVCVSSGHAQRWVEGNQLVSEFNHGLGNWMGFSVAIDGDLAVVGSPEYKESDGIVGIYRKDETTWKLISTLQNGENNLFGASVGISGGTIAVGCYSDSLVYVYYEQDQWTIPDKVALPEKENSQRFGRSVGIYGDTLVIGAHGSDDNAGAAYIFKKTDGTWVLSQKLTPEEPVEEERFGHAVAISPDYLLVAAMNSDAAYVFDPTENGWKQSAKLPVPFSSDYVVTRPSSCVSIANDVAVVGTPYNSDSSWRAGAAFVFEKDGSAWKQTARLDASDVGRTQVFGHSVSIAGGAIAIGSWGSGGGAYLYEKEENEWKEVKKIQVDTAYSYAHNFAVAMSGNNIITGAPFDGPGENGSVHFLERHPLNWHDVRIQKVDISDYPLVAGAHKFGRGVALSDKIAVIGAPDENTSGKKSGAAYVYRIEGDQLVKQTKLVPERFFQIDGHRFGSAVSIYK